MLEKNEKYEYRSVAARPSAIVAIIVVVAGTVAAQDPSASVSQNAFGNSMIPLGRFDLALPQPAASAGVKQWLGGDAPTVDFTGVASTENLSIRRNGGWRRVTLEQVKQQAFVNPSPNPLAHLAQLSIEAAKQHRLGAQADYFPKIGATVANLHYSEFLGQVVSLQRPIAGSAVQVPVPLLTQNQTVVAVSFVQPITPLFQVYQLVKIARADERIAMAKAGVTVARNTSTAQLEEAYFKLLIAQRRLTAAELKLRNTETWPQYASASLKVVSTPAQDPESGQASKALATASTEVRELTASLNRMVGWPEDTELELIPPEPLVENISLEDVADQPTSANSEVVEAEQTAVKARAASVLSKLAYMPTVAAMSGFIYQNAVPLMPNTFGYGGVMVSYNIFDFGKREHAVKEASAQLGMAETAVELTKAKVAANMKTSYSELERTRLLSAQTQKMASVVTRLMTVSSNPESADMIAARVSVETEMLEADMAHRQAYARLKALMGPQK
jgi:outer membrane protein